LQLGAVAQSVEVSAAAALIDVTSAKVSTNVDRQFVSELPTITHNALSYAELAPGVRLHGPARRLWILRAPMPR